MTVPDHLKGKYAVLLFRGRGLISALIRWQTRGEVSHAAFLTPEGGIIEAWQGAGVRCRTLDDWDGVEAYSVVGVTDEQWPRIIASAWGELGCGYDYASIVRFLTRTRAPSNTRWFCSELVFAKIFSSTGIALLGRTTASEESPQSLRKSPLLNPILP